MTGSNTTLDTMFIQVRDRVLLEEDPKPSSLALHCSALQCREHSTGMNY